ncbi:hypothetical protein FK531_09065 [Rhodococcus spelaei]|uniref:Uncharacterized protein n=1 Tax=Rhodococcus spelaei TaxID=2546320 RepID=A0A541BN35_9NOCA|nr:hypothetical protein FK531_09065 [Rhodococcus spelaei]
MVAAAACVVALVVLVVVLGVLTPPRPSSIATDRLGPDSGEEVAQYLDRARASLAEPESGDPRWALVSLAPETTARQAYTLADGVRVSQVLFRVPLDRVQTPLIVVDVAGEESVLRAPAVAADRSQGSTGEWDRQAQIDAVSATRLAQDCACVVGLTVRGDLDRLRALAGTPGVRAVEALPPDAVFGRFAVNPLLPEQTQTAAPGPDDGEVPAQ